MSIRILLADDHEVVREGISGLLTKKGFVVVAEANNGRDAVRLAQEHSPDIVLMDISMPDLNGIEATKQIRAENRKIKVIGLSMHSDKRFIAKMLGAGAAGYLRKNCPSEELYSAIRTVAGGQIYLSPKLANLVVRNFVHHAEEREKEDATVLTSKEYEILQLLAEGKSTKEMADRLNVSVKTIEKHREHIMAKLDMHSVAELTKYAIREGMTSLEE